MSLPYQFIDDLGAQIPDLQPDSIISRTIFADDRVKVILFAFATGQELSEHTASVPAMIHILEGEARLSLGKDSFEAHPGTFAHMQAQLPHSIYARTPTKMLLIMLQKNG
jgi:quercetin dioxygenase-like cupin family protein